MTEHILYTFRRCPYAIRARMALAYAGINVELRELMLKDKPADMLKHSPKGTVPVVITDSGLVIDESLDVMLWALAQNDPDGWLEQKDSSLSLIQQNDQQFKPLLDKYKYADRYPEFTEKQHRENSLSYIDQLETLLQQNKFLTGDSISLADMAIFPFIRQFALVNKSWFDELPHQQLQRWLNHFLNSHLFSKVMQKFKLYNDGFRYHFPSNHMID